MIFVDKSRVAMRGSDATLLAEYGVISKRLIKSGVKPESLHELIDLAAGYEDKKDDDKPDTFNSVFGDLL